MATPTPTPTTTSVQAEDDVGGRRLAAAVASLAAAGDDDGVHQLLAPLEADQLRALVLTMATNQAASPQHRTHAAAVDVDLSSPSAVCDLAVTQAAQGFGTTPEAILGADRHRTVTDARAVAMTAVRRSGLTLTAIADHFDKDHTSVIHAVRRTEDNPRLLSAATSIGERIASRYDQATEPVSDLPAEGADGGRAAARSAGAVEEQRRPQLTAVSAGGQGIGR